MVDPLTVIGAAASVLQIAATLCQGLKTLRDAAMAPKDISAKLDRMKGKVQQMSVPMSAIKDYIEARSVQIPNESELHVVILELSKRCDDCLRTLKSRLPAVPRGPRSLPKQVATAFHHWLREGDFKQTEKDIDGHIQNLTSIMTFLNL